MVWGGRKPVYVQVIICIVCKKQFSHDGYRAAPKKYCSYQCAMIAKTESWKKRGLT